MSEITRRERMRVETDLEIRQHARRLLVAEGREAVTLRAIARELGITAPALYRYYDSREDMLRQLCVDICDDLADELNRALEEVGEDDYREKLFTVCRGFRRWALGHPREFTLVFASPADETGTDTGEPAQDQLGSVFLRVIGPLMSEGATQVVNEGAPSDLHNDLAPNQEALAAAFTIKGIEVPEEATGPHAVYFLLRWWIRIYGHVALEVFRRFPFDVAHADRLFESLLTELTQDVGLDG
ncbi:AcrR family transcriptional regulator [Saccharopolyspora lacisalsi]|uniref:AcrR family transcriptional regulator n=1 Tax=Halosaccharopolyspora lacisalsi TaxID=1000566 RepID=A0A839E714_9PSEU|nr:TetR/AcrR family transcriptional regulator [Halosaccharopolyspora lacisalsi]MBA8827695.1 AcrR family transcriptional regulator [Halosaccharopolyspora lacisalsi]